ncbi:BON domain-containing protein [bacterium]|nr:BON domain-containing protein [bacterium]
MLVYRKWVLSLGIAAVTPGITLAGPFSFFKSDRSAQESQAVDNQKLAEQAAANLRAAKLRGFDMEIEVQKGVCTLKGKIASAQQKQQAEAACLAVAGISKVNNQLSVLEGTPAQDAQPQSAPAQSTQPQAAPSQPVASQPAPSAAPKLPQEPVQQAVAQGSPTKSVEQTGFLGFGRKTEPQQSAANEQQLANAVAMAVQQSGLHGHDLNLKVQNGTAVLSGRAASPQDVAALTQIASRVPGIRQVQNNVLAPGMRAPAPPKTPNQHVAEQIANALAANHLSGLDIEVRYNNGTATLSGMVPHPQVREIAQQITASVPGVQQVANNLIAPAAPQAGPQGYPQGAPVQQVAFQQQGGPAGAPPMMAPPAMASAGGASHMAYDLPHLPAYAWPSYASYPNSAQISYPQEYSASAWPYIGPFYPYPQVPLGWRQVQLEWDDGNWNLNFRPRTERWFWFLDSNNW